VARVLAAGGTLLGGGGVSHGDRVDVLGFVDWVIDLAVPAAGRGGGAAAMSDAPPASRGPRGEPLAPVLRSAEDLSLVVIAGA